MPPLRSIIILVILSSGYAFGFSAKRPEVSPMPDFNREVPVQLFRGAQIFLGFTDRGVLECFRNGEFAEIYYITSSFRLSTRSEGISIYDDNGEVASGLSDVNCKPRGASSYAEFDGMTFRGFFKVIYDSLAADLILLNLVDLEEYLQGVLPAEIGERSKEEFEAARAQAVAARTYAVWKLISDGESGILYPTVADQVYIGKNSEIDILNRAVRKTEGEIMMFKGGPIAAYYHAACGGATIPIEKAWPEKDRFPYLVGTDDDDYCRWARTYSWTESFDLKTLFGNLKNYFIGNNLISSDDLFKITDIQFYDDTLTGRNLKMDINCGSKIFTVENDQIRWALGRPSKPGSILPSTRFSVKKITDENGLLGLEITGVGNGHGVGACQCGFIGRARAGQKYRDMLQQYYQGVKIVKIY